MGTTHRQIKEEERNGGTNMWQRLMDCPPKHPLPTQQKTAPIVLDLLSEAAKLAHHVGQLQRTSTTPLRDLGWSMLHGYKGPSDLVRCNTCGRTMLHVAFDSHRLLVVGLGGHGTQGDRPNIITTSFFIITFIITTTGLYVEGVCVIQPPPCHL